VTGATVHYVNEVPDGGEIILQKAVTIRLGETPESLQRRVMQQAEWKILPRAVELVAARLAGNKRDAKQKGASR
jgi:phosphoribosylglycinamide formyltransferase-1